jgi:hypothetical protein
MLTYADVCRPSWSHMRALNWVLQEVVFRDYRDALLLVLDPDVFLLRPFTIKYADVCWRMLTSADVC